MGWGGLEATKDFEDEDEEEDEGRRLGRGELGGWGAACEGGVGV